MRSPPKRPRSPPSAGAPWRTSILPPTFVPPTRLSLRGPPHPLTLGSRNAAPRLHSAPRAPLCTLHRPKPTASPSAQPARPNSSPAATPQPASATSAYTGLSLALLNLVTVLWGTQHAIIKLAVQDTSPAALNLSRFLLAALISLPSLPPPTRPNLRTYAAGLELSVYLFLGYALQSVSLLTTPAARSGFLLYLNVKLVPLLARVLYGRAITPLTWGSAGLALLGTALLTYDGSLPAPGDVWSVLAAAASAMFILRLERAARLPAPAINAVSLTSVSALCAVWSLFVTAPSSVDDVVSAILPGSPTGVAAVLYLGLVTTALSNYLQTLGQRHVPAERAAVIFAMDPVYGAFFAYALLGESLGAQGFVGAACIVVAAVLSNRDAGERKTEGTGR